MKRIAMLVLTVAAVTDISQEAYNSDLFDAIAQRKADQPVLHLLAQSPLTLTIGYWALFFLGFGVLSLLMSSRKPQDGPDIIG